MRKPNEKERLETYKRVLEILQNGEVVHGLNTHASDGLCMYLPCVFYNIHWENDNYKYGETTKLFPEFGDKYENFDGLIDNEWRIKVLEEIISEMEAK